MSYSSDASVTTSDPAVSSAEVSSSVSKLARAWGGTATLKTRSGTGAKPEPRSLDPVPSTPKRPPPPSTISPKPRDPSPVSKPTASPSGERHPSPVAVEPTVGGSPSAKTEEPTKLSTMAQMKKDMEAKELHDSMELLAAGIQNNASINKLSFVGKDDTRLFKTVKVNQALAGHLPEVSPEETIAKLVPNLQPAVMKRVLAEFKTIPPMKPTATDEEIKVATTSFSKFTKEGYENVTGIARGDVRYDKGLKADRPMKEEEILDGKKTLKDLEDNWAVMPKFRGSTVFRVIHAGTAEDKGDDGSVFVKPNPTSTGVTMDLSRLGDGKTACKITIISSGDDTLPVDTRVVSTYANEAEILLAPKTTFTKVGKEGAFTLFNAKMP